MDRDAFAQPEAAADPLAIARHQPRHLAGRGGGVDRILRQGAKRRNEQQK